MISTMQIPLELTMHVHLKHTSSDVVLCSSLILKTPAAKLSHDSVNNEKV